MILHAGPSQLPLPARRGGAVERRMLELAEAQARAGERVIVYSGGAEDGWAEYRGVTIRYLNARPAEFALRFVQDAARRAPRVIHVHNRAEIAWLARRASLAPTVLSCDYHFEPWRRFAALRRASRAVWRRCLLAASRIAPVSDYCLAIHRDYWQLPAAQFAPIPNGVDCTRFHPAAAPRLDHRATILYVGRLCEQKGTDLLIAAYRMLRRPAALIVAGPCGQFGQTARTGLAAEVEHAGGRYLPPVDDADLPALYNACDIFVMPTRELEMFGMAAVEAQACGKPVVASDHGGLRETVPSTAGLRFRTGDAAALAAALDTLLDRAGLRAELAAGARANALEYDWPRIAARCQEVYATL